MSEEKPQKMNKNKINCDLAVIDYWEDCGDASHCSISVFSSHPSAASFAPAGDWWLIAGC